MPQPAVVEAGGELPRDPAEPLTEHLIDLRRRLLMCLAWWIFGSLLCYAWSADILSWMAKTAGGVVFTRPTEAFMTRIKAAAFLGFVAALPFILHQAWLFVARAVSPKFGRLCLGLAAASYLLFLSGASLAVFVVVPAAMRFLLAFGREQIRPLMTLSGYIEFVVSLALSFGGVFQLPIVLVALNRMGLVSRKTLRNRWRYVYLFAFVAAAILAPPDAFSQVALAIPAIIVFELTLLFLN